MKLPTTAIKNEIKPFIIATLAIAFYAICLNLLSWQFQLMSGGAPGYALIVNYLSGFPVGQTLLILNTIIIILAFLIAGYVAGFRAIYGFIALAVLIDVFNTLLHLDQTTLPTLWGFATTGFFGILGGFSIALVIAVGYSVGGLSTIVPIVQKFKPFPPEKIIIVLDAILTLITAFTLGINGAIAIAINGVAFYFAMKWTLKWLKSHSSSLLV